MNYADARVRFSLSLLVALFPIVGNAHSNVSELVKKIAPVGFANSSGFGGSASIRGGMIVVGAPRALVGQVAQVGAAYVFDARTGSMISKLTPEDSGPGSMLRQFFGYSVATNGRVAVIGAWGDSSLGLASGAAYLFDLYTGTQIARLIPDDLGTFERFGFSVAIHGSTAIVGSPSSLVGGVSTGAAYLFDANSGAQIAKLSASDGSFGDAFGVSVAISSTTAVIGAQSTDDNGSSSGSAYLFDLATGLERAKLVASDGEAQDSFGSSVGINDEYVLVGAPGDDDQGSESGSVYVFDAITAVEQSKLIPVGSLNIGRFGSSLDVADSTAIIGAPGLNGFGSAFLFDLETGQQIEEISPTNLVTRGWFGTSVAIGRNRIVVGEPEAVIDSHSTGVTDLYDRDQCR